MRTRLRRLLKPDAFKLALAIGAFFIVAHEKNVFDEGSVPVIARIEYAAQDFAVTRLRGPRKPYGDVVIVAVDEKSIREEGRWPWSRAKLARLVQNLGKGGVAAVGFDMVWADDDEMGHRLADVAQQVEKEKQAAKDPAEAKQLDLILSAARGKDASYAVTVDPDEQLARAVESAKNVVLGMVLLSEDEVRRLGRSPADLKATLDNLAFFRMADPVLVPLAGGKVVEDPRRVVGHNWSDVLAPLPGISAAADMAGYFNVDPDRDGIIRHYTTFARVGDLMFPALGVATLVKAQWAPGGVQPTIRPVAVGQSSSRVQALKVGKYSVETDDDGRALLDYYGSYKDFPTWSASDVLHGRIPADEMKGKVAVVGNTAIGTWDQRVTPFDDFAPGVITHATFIDNVLHDELLLRNPYVEQRELFAFVLVTLALAWVFAKVRSAAAGPALVLGVGGWMVFATLALSKLRWVFAIGTPVTSFFMMFIAATTYRFFTEEREKRKARETFSRFLAPAVVDELMRSEKGLKLGGQKRELTVLFSDIRGFTTISERLDPHTLLEILNEYLTPMTDIIVSDHQGTLDKYMGDAIMAFWGAPRELPDHALLACHAALRMMSRLRELKERWRDKGLPEIDIGIGINTGPMSVGFVGSQDRFYNYTVLGDNVNLASRLEGANKEYGTNVIISAMTYEQVKGRVYVRELDAVRVKGKREPVVVYELMGLGAPPPDLAPFLDAFGAGLAAYKAQRWDEAIASFKKASELRHGDYCARKYVTRCESMRDHPPGANWDGVYEMKTK